MRIARVFPLLLHQVRVVQYQYVHSATLLMQYRFQTVNQQLHAPRRQALLRLRSTNIYSLRPVKVVLGCYYGRVLTHFLFFTKS
jgi:hypothetical protein